jgi:GntR family transcriptional regulator/MocR family aminotransferase
LIVSNGAASGGKVLGIVLDRSSRKTLGRQLCEQLRSAILSGQLEGGTRLPSTRELCEDLRVSRNLVLEAYDQLRAEGFIEGRSGSGSYVAPGVLLPGALPSAPSPALEGSSSRGSIAHRDTIDFRTGLPALEYFPQETWARLLGDAARHLPERSFDYGPPEGLPALREAVSAYLFRARGVRASPEDVVITSGTTQTLQLITKIVCGHDGGVVLEDPSHRGYSELLLKDDIPIVPVGVDELGLCPESLPTAGARLVYTTPSHQFPLGMILPAARRAALISWARKHDALVVEDDYDGEFRYDGAPILPLRELDPGRVVYAGSFSKIFSPAIRLGYAIIPPSLREDWRFFKRHADVHSSTIEQAALASYLSSGRLERHILRMRKVYSFRRAALLDAIERRFGSDCEVGGAAAGLHATIRVRYQGDSDSHREWVRFDAALIARIATAGVRVYPASAHALGAAGDLDIVALFGYAHLEESRIEEGIGRLADILGR